MGSLFSSRQKEDNTYLSPETVTDFTIHKCAAPQSQQSAKKCSTEEYCKIEEVEINAIKKMKEMDEANTKKLNLTDGIFDETWDNFMKNNASVMETLNVPTFTEEREKVAEAFSGGSNCDKQEAQSTYQQAVDEKLTEISKRRASQPDPPPPPEDPKKKK